MLHRLRARRTERTGVRPSRPDAAAQLAAALVRLLGDADLRLRLGRQAHQDARAYDYAVYAEALLADFTQLTAPAKPASSAP